MPKTNEISHEDEDAIRALLLGRTVTKVDDDALLLDDGTRLTIVPYEGDGINDAGGYELTELNDSPINAIMAVEFDVAELDGPDGDVSYRIFVLAADERIKLMQMDGADGNGWYGTGYWIEVQPTDA